jgi:hypothetical protein
MRMLGILDGDYGLGMRGNIRHRNCSPTSGATSITKAPQAPVMLVTGCFGSGGWQVHFRHDLPEKTLPG